MPESVTVNGETCYLKTDFKRWITFELILTDPNIVEQAKLAAMLPLCLKKLPSNIDVAVEACLKFYSGKDNLPLQHEKSVSKPLYSFLYDAELIYSAFMSQYGIDLSGNNMHWYKFRALFKGLKPDNKISEVMQIRGTNLSDIKDDDKRRKYQSLKRYWAIPDIRSMQEKDSEIVQAVEQLF